MRRYKVVVGPRPADVLRALPPDIKRSVRNALRALAEEPALGQPLRGELEGLWRYRVRRFRVVYAVDRAKRTVRVLAVGHRSTIYETLAEAGHKKRKRD